MKKILYLAIILFFIPALCFGAGPFGSAWHQNADGTYSLPNDTDGLKVGSVSAGVANSTEGAEVAIHEGMIESDTGTESVGVAITEELLDETDGTEDVVVRIYRMEAGSLLMANYFGPALAAAPSGAHAPAYGCIAIADRATWDPASVGSGGAYLVWYDGDSWEAIDGQAD